MRNALQPVFGGGKTDGVVSKIPAAFGAFTFSTYLGGYSDTPFIESARFIDVKLVVEGDCLPPAPT